jgi:hypothetical protein
MAPRKVTREDLAQAAGAAVGTERKIRKLARLAGGTTKGVYRLAMDDDTTVIAYVWGGSENFWPQAPNENDVADPFSSGNSIDLFSAAHGRLASLGLRARTRPTAAVVTVTGVAVGIPVVRSNRPVA